MTLLNEEASKKQREELKRIKALTTSVLAANPTLQDNTSELISKIGVLTNASFNE